MPRYDIALVATIEADSYEAAQREAIQLAEAVAMTEEISISAVLDYERDNEGQRVLYLEHEDGPIVGFGGDPDFPSVAAGEPVRQNDLSN